jgi:hypothetical protein
MILGDLPGSGGHGGSEIGDGGAREFPDKKLSAVY